MEPFLAEAHPHEEECTIFDLPMKMEIQTEDESITILLCSPISEGSSSCALTFSREYRVINRKEYEDLPRPERGHRK